MSEKSICLVLPYFGRWPNYFNLWLNSCAHNSTIDFLLLTDNEVREPCPKNIHIIKCTFAELRDRFKSFFDFKISLTQPYKFCDFRPAYGLVLKDYLDGYDYWGHCDCDLIFGNIRKFITDECLSKYDRILSRGHLLIYRNTDDVNSFFMREIDGVVPWRKAFSEKRAFCFDEWGGASMLWRALAPSRFYDEIIYDDIDYARKEFVSSQKVRFIDDERNKCFCIFRYEEGNLSRIYIDLRDGSIKRDPSCYVHFQKRPMQIDTTNENRFLMIPNRFVDDIEPSVSLLRKWGRHRFFYGHYLNIRLKNLQKRIGRALGMI